MRDDTDVLSLAEWRNHVRSRRHGLEQRLEDGYQRIDQALAEGADVGAWEDFWLQLLREYERVCDDLSAAA